MVTARSSSSTVGTPKAAMTARAAGPAKAKSALGGNLGRATPTLAVVSAATLAAMMMAAKVVVPSRADGLPWAFLTIAALSAGVLIIALRHGSAGPRISDPGLLVLGWCGYYLVGPMFEWLRGSVIWERDTSEMLLDAAMFATLQREHTIFIVAFAACYRLVAPGLDFAALTAPALEKLPRPRYLLLAGALPLIAEAADRLVRTGSIRPTAAYGDLWFDMQGGISEARSSGGLQYLLTQIELKLGLVSPLVLGLGFGLLFAPFAVRRQWGRLAALQVIFPVLTYLGLGSRSVVAISFVVAFVVVDVVAGALPWRYVVIAVVAGAAFFDFYGSFRRYQADDLAEAVSRAREEQSEGVEHNEASAMLVKTAFMIKWSEATAQERGISYFADALLWFVPSQILPEKTEWQATSAFLSRELLGPEEAERGSGVAGTMVGDGYMVGGDIGVGLLAAVLGALAGLVVRIVSRAPQGRTGVPLWRVALLAALVARTFSFVRDDLQSVLQVLVYGIGLPAVLFGAALSLGLLDRRWTLLLQQRSPSPEAPHSNSAGPVRRVASSLAQVSTGK